MQRGHHFFTVKLLVPDGALLLSEERSIITRMAADWAHHIPVAPGRPRQRAGKPEPTGISSTDAGQAGGETSAHSGSDHREGATGGQEGASQDEKSDEDSDSEMNNNGFRKRMPGENRSWQSFLNEEETGADPGSP